jgi:hypothetical protein
LVDLKRLQKARFLFQCRTPFREDRIVSLVLLIAFFNDLLDGHFPFVKTHQRCLVIRYLGEERLPRRTMSVRSILPNVTSSIVMARLARRNFDRLVLPEDFGCSSRRLRFRVTSGS